MAYQEALFSYESLIPPEPNYEQLTINDIKKAPWLEEFASIRPPEEDRIRFRDLNSSSRRLFHLVDVMENISNTRCLRDIRLIYDIDIPVMASLLGVSVEQVEEYEQPEFCQTGPRASDEPYNPVLTNDVRRLVANLETCGFTRGEVAPIITQDVTTAAKMVQRKGRASVEPLVDAAFHLFLAIRDGPKRARGTRKTTNSSV